MLLADYPVSNWKDAVTKMFETTRIMFCAACKVTRRVAKGIVKAKCTCGAELRGVEQEPALPETLAALEQKHHDDLNP